MFFDTGKTSTDTLVRPSTTQDNITPSGTSIACEVLLKLAKIFGNDQYEQIVLSQVKSSSTEINRFPAPHSSWINKLNIEKSFNQQIVILGSRNNNEVKSMIKVANQILCQEFVFGFSENLEESNEFKILENKEIINGLPTAFFCENYICKLPVNSANELSASLNSTLLN
jgi:uncharacterized protein YyaL (SSP411 family)